MPAHATSDTAAFVLECQRRRTLLHLHESTTTTAAAAASYALGTAAAAATVFLVAGRGRGQRRAEEGADTQLAGGGRVVVVAGAAGTDEAAVGGPLLLVRRGKRLRSMVMVIGQVVEALKRCPLRVFVAAKQETPIQRGGRRGTEDGGKAGSVLRALLVGGGGHRRAVLRVLFLPQVLREIIGLLVDVGSTSHSECCCCWSLPR